MTTTTTFDQVQRLQAALVNGADTTQVAHMGRQLLLMTSNVAAHSVAYRAQAAPPWLPGAIRLQFAERAIECARAAARWALHHGTQLHADEATSLLVRAFLTAAEAQRSAGDFVSARMFSHEAFMTPSSTPDNVRCELTRGRIALSEALAGEPGDRLEWAAHHFQDAFERLGPLGVGEEQPCEEANLRAAVLIHLSFTQFLTARRVQADGAMHLARSLTNSDQGGVVVHPRIREAADALFALLIRHNELEQPVNEVPEVALPFARLILRNLNL